jgi:DNA segregation ATPase FtsK/SpoIIIE-like protein
MKGVDLNLFEGTPHLLTGEIDEIPDGIVKKDNQIVPLFEWLEKENNRRQALFSNRRIRNISEWNKKNRKYHLARIIVCVDEFARLMRSDYEKKKFINLIYDLASTARATGIYLILATQFAKDKYVSTDIKMNIPARLCFSVPDLQGSVCMIDTGEAVNLYPPAGRGIFAHGVNKFKIQSPLITSKQILEIVRKAQQGKTVKELEEGTDLTEEEVVTWALNENNGSLQTLNTFQHFAGRLEANNLKKMLQGMDGKIFVIDDVEYRIVPPAGGARGRKLEKVELEKEVENE